ncbi:MAG: substrate-binding domain-containing protein [Sulfuriflexus sp.]|nr:substrate-binding domain-containing protein [Sulfuriflexus sp.]
MCNINAIIRNLLCILVACLLTMPIISNADSNELVTGAGAHSSWVILNKLKPILEKESGYDITLFGKQSMLGVGCNAGIKSTAQSSPQHENFGMLCCPLDDAEISEKNLEVFPLALEPLMILGHEKNPITNLSTKQVKAIFSGEINNWKAVGGLDKSIVVVTRLHCKKRPGHWKRILPTPEAFTRKRINVQSADEMVKRVGDFESAIGHAGTAWLRGESSHTKIIRVNGYLPTSENVKKGNYKFFRQLSIITKNDASKRLKDLMRRVQKEVVKNSELLSEYQLLPSTSPSTH